MTFSKLMEKEGLEIFARKGGGKVKWMGLSKNVEVTYYSEGFLEIPHDVIGHTPLF